MNLAISDQQRHSCLLCRYDFHDEFVLGRLRMLEHLRNVHSRTMIHEVERGKRNKVWLYTGPRIKKGLEVN